MHYVSPMTHPLHSLFVRNLAGTALAHDTYFEQLRKAEFSRLDDSAQVYLDYTGGGLHGASQVERHLGRLMNGVHGNPHSVNPTSMASTQSVEEARSKVLSFFGAEQDYYCIFTPNASGALKIVGECYPFSDDGAYLLTADNHNSVNGIREYCKAKGSAFHYAPIQKDLSIDGPQLKSLLAGVQGRNKLFAFPAQSNVSGVRHPLKWIRKAQRAGWDVMLDAAAFAPTSPLDLSEVRPEFVAVSFYKIFGYPTGIGALLVRKDAFAKLEKPWYAGGNITLSSVGAANRFLFDDHQRFEDGTVNYLDIPAISEGLDFVTAIGMERIKERVESLSKWLHDGLSEIRHPNGEPVVRFYGPRNRKRCGGTLSMNFLDASGAPIPFQVVEDAAAQKGISLRTGCFCNPGIDEVNHGIDADALRTYFGEREAGDYFDFMNYSGIARGAVRVSVGVPTNRADLVAFKAFVSDFVATGQAHDEAVVRKKAA